MSEISKEGDCFHLQLSLYPAAAGIKHYSNKYGDEIPSNS
jgi:hypothetical protein